MCKWTCFETYVLLKAGFGISNSQKVAAKLNFESFAIMAYMVFILESAFY